MTADPASASALAIEFGVQWTPSHGQPQVATTPITAGHAEQLARQLRASQRVLGHDADATVVYRVPGGEWLTNPHGLPCGAEALLQDFLRWMEENPDMPQLVVDDPEHPNA